MLTLIWLIPAAITAPLWGYACYTERWDDRPRRPSEIPAGNARWATAIGIVYGLAWPALLCLLVLFIGIEWLNAGGKK